MKMKTEKYKNKSFFTFIYKTHFLCYNIELGLATE